MMLTTVIHEVGHNLGIAHHKAPDGAINKDGVSQLIPGSADGVQNCAMRYGNIEEDHDEVACAVKYTRYCTKNDKAIAYTYTYPNCCKVDKDGNFDTDGITGKITGKRSKPSDDCYGQITLKAKHK